MAINMISKFDFILYFQMNLVYDLEHGKNRHVNTEWRHLLVTQEAYSTLFHSEAQRTAGARDQKLSFLLTKKAIEVLRLAPGK